MDSISGLASWGLLAGWIGLSLVMAAGFAALTKRWVLTAVWVGGIGGAAALGLFDGFVPPRLMLVLVPGLVGLSVLAWRSDWHRRPLELLVGFQAFRIAVELLIHASVSQGIAPPQMTWDGMNLDIVSGMLALVMGPFATRLPRWSLHLFNVVGAGLLFNVVTVAVLSMPTPLQVFEPDNVWIAAFPFAWLPTVHVMLAWLGHLLLFKRLREDAE